MRRETYCLLSFLPQMPSSVGLWWDQSEEKQDVLFTYTTMKTGVVLYCSRCFSLSSQIPLISNINPHVRYLELSKFWVLHRLFLLQTFFLEWKSICRQTKKCGFAQESSLSFWYPLEQKGSVAVLWFSSLTCVSLLFTDILDFSSGWHYYLKGSFLYFRCESWILPILPWLCVEGWWLWCLLF